MELAQIIQQRRSLRSLAPVEITEELLGQLREAAALAPSCFNNQPWRYVLVSDPKILEKVKETLFKGNEWVFASNLIFGVFTKKELDCVIKSREYHWFDTGMSSGFLILRAWDLGLVAHPIAGFDPEKAAAALNIPQDMQLLTLIILGKKAGSLSPALNQQQIEAENNRPERKPYVQMFFNNQVSG